MIHPIVFEPDDPECYEEGVQDFDQDVFDSIVMNNHSFPD